MSGCVCVHWAQAFSQPVGHRHGQRKKASLRLLLATAISLASTPSPSRCPSLSLSLLLPRRRLFEHDQQLWPSAYSATATAIATATTVLSFARETREKPELHMQHGLAPNIRIHRRSEEEPRGA